jgi:cytochrome P450
MTQVSVNDILCYLLNLILPPELYDNPDVFNPERYLLTLSKNAKSD